MNKIREREQKERRKVKTRFKRNTGKNHGQKCYDKKRRGKR